MNIAPRRIVSSISATARPVSKPFSAVFASIATSGVTPSFQTRRPIRPITAAMMPIVTTPSASALSMSRDELRSRQPVAERLFVGDAQMARDQEQSDEQEDLADARRDPVEREFEVRMQQHPRRISHCRHDEQADEDQTEEPGECAHVGNESFRGGAYSKRPSLSRANRHASQAGGGHLHFSTKPTRMALLCASRATDNRCPAIRRSSR